MTFRSARGDTAVLGRVWMLSTCSAVLCRVWLLSPTLLCLKGIVYTALWVLQCMNKCCAVIDTIWLVSARFSVLGKISF